MTCVRRPIVLVEVTETAAGDPVSAITGTWVIKGALPVFEPGEVDWPGDKAVQAGTTPAGRTYLASSPYVRDWTPDTTFEISLDRALDHHFASAHA